MEIIILLVFGFVMVVALSVSFACLDAESQAKERAAIESAINSLPGFTASQMILTANYEAGLAIDESHKKACLIAREAGKPVLQIINYADILASEIFVDGETITSSVRASQFAGVLLGGLALGGVGAVIGGLSGKTKTSSKIRNVDLRLTINDASRPLHDIAFMEAEGPKDGFYYKRAMDHARHWHALVKVIMRYADSQDVNHESSNSASLPESFASQLQTLATLRDRGILTEDEFSEQKMKLLRMA